MPNNPFDVDPDNPFDVDPDNPFDVENIAQQAKAEAAERQAVLLESTSRQLGNNVLGLIPGLSGLAGDVLATGAAVPNFAGQSLDAMFTGGEAPSFGEVVASEKEQFPASALRSFAAPTVTGLEADTRALPALLPGGDTFTERRALKLDEINTRLNKQREAFPLETGGGDILGDIISLLGFRQGAGLPGKMARFEKKLFEKPLVNPRLGDPGVQKQFASILNSAPVRNLAKGAGRTGEAGLEAMALDIMHSDDPFETLPYAVGLQAAESGALQFGRSTISGGKVGALSGVAIAAFVTGMGLELVRDTMPGDESNWVSSVDDGLEKVRWTLLAGFIAGLAGGRRVRNTALAENIPWLAEGLSAVPRAAVLSVVEGYANADEEARAKIETNLQSLQDPSNLDEETATRLMEAIKEDRFLEELQK